MNIGIITASGFYEFPELQVRAGCTIYQKSGDSFRGHSFLDIPFFVKGLEYAQSAVEKLRIPFSDKLIRAHYGAAI